MANAILTDDEQEEEESYFISMTDIMVGLLFIFVILLMYLVLQIREAPVPDTVPRDLYEITKAENRRLLDQLSALEAVNKFQQREIDALKAQIAAMERNRLELYLKAADERRTQILREISQLLIINGIPVEVIEEQGILRLRAELLFETGVSILEPDSRADEAVRHLADAFRQILPCYTIGKLSDPVRNSTCNPSAAFVDAVFVEGHTDSAAINGEIEPGINSNLRLSSRRATNTLERMLEFQPDLAAFLSVSAKVTSSDQPDQARILNASAYGDSRPIASNETEVGRRQNRRIDIRLLMYTPRSDTIEIIEQLVGKTQ